MNDVTVLLDAAAAGDRQAAARLLPIVYDELRKLATAWMDGEVPGNTLNGTALVHEAYLRLVQPGDSARWQNRGHFFAAAAESMRRILVDAARRKRAKKHGGGMQRHDATEIEIAESASNDDLVALDEALDRFAALDPQKADLVKLRYFAGLNVEQAAEALGISLATANRHWAYAKAWLFQEISEAKENSEYR